MRAGEVREEGDFELDGVPFPAAEIRLEFIDPAADDAESASGAMFPNGQSELLARAEAVRAHGAVAMGLVRSADEATKLRPHTPTLAFIARPPAYVASSGRPVEASSIDLLARIFSMGVLHHAMTGTGAMAIAAAASVPGTLVHRFTPVDVDGTVRFGHPSGTLRVGAGGAARRTVDGSSRRCR